LRFNPRKRYAPVSGRGRGCGLHYVRLHAMLRATHCAIALLTAVGVFVAAEIAEPSRFKHPKITYALFELEQARTAIAQYRRDVGSPPHSLQALAAAGYIRNFDRDPWDQPYVYRVRGNEFSVYSIGVNGKDDNEGRDDVTSEEKHYTCEEYTVNCPPSVAEAAKVTSLLLALVSSACLAFFGARGLWRLRGAI
jgi:hypothetical protein